MSDIRIVPVLPLRDIVVFPHMVVPLFVGRDKSVRALEEVMKGDKQILLATQKNSADDDPQPGAIYDVGVLASVLQLLKLPDGTVKVLVEGKSRSALLRFTDQADYFEAEIADLEEDGADAPEAEALSRAVAEQFENYVKLNKKVPPEALASIPQIAEPGKLADSIAAHLSVKISDKQQLLEIFNVAKRLEKVYALMEGEISVLQVEKKIRSRVKRQMEKTQREYYLNEQMKAIQRELGEQDDARDELIELEKRIKKTKLSKEARTNSLKGPILCLVGPPGVGKTSLGRSIAKATNPFFLLDEIDKLGADWRGDPSSALLEVLDPAQNSTFADHYLEVDYDLSQVMFVTTANSLNMPQPLMDRMEIIRIPGYTEDEKLEIAKRHILPRLAKDHGLKEGEWVVPDSAIRDLIRYYTREAGVRSLERELGNLARKAVRELMAGKAIAITVDDERLAKYAGVRKYRYGETDAEDQQGIVTGLAWTEFGGDILTIEAVKMPGKGRMTVTGNLKEVMKESISAAASYVRSRATRFGLKPPMFEKTDVHVHVPEGATPKDGPSAGVAMSVAIVSVLTGIPVRKDIAMTGEITLRGRVLAIGGLKEKLLAALRSGVKTVLIPSENEKDLADIPDNVKAQLEIIPVATADEALAHALTGPLTPIEWHEEDEPATPARPDVDLDGDAVVTH